MKHIFTLSGNSERFTKEGFNPKPLIKVGNKMVLEHVLDLYPHILDRDITFIVNDQDVKNHNIERILREMYPLAGVFVIPSHRRGPVSSILQIEKHIDLDSPYLVTYCDVAWQWTYQNFITKLKISNCDGCLVTHSGKHPHRMRAINFAHLKVDGEKVLEVKEKGWYTDNPINEYASSGVYYFRTGRILKQYCEKLIEDNEIVNGEFYVTLVYNPMIRDGLKVIYYPTDNYVCFGTPFELVSFKYWKSIIDMNMTDDEVQFVKNYWEKYHDSNKK